MVWEPASCCGCCSPRKGTLCLGIFGVVSAVLNVFSVIKTALMSTQQVEDICIAQREYMDENDCIRYSGIGIVVSGIEVAIQGIISIMLIMGVKKGNQCLMLPYMIFQVFGIIAIGGIFMIIVVLFSIHQLWVGTIVSIVVGAAMTFLCTYCFLVVRTCYKEIKQQNLMRGTEIERGYMLNQERAPPAYKM